MVMVQYTAFMVGISEPLVHMIWLCGVEASGATNGTTDVSVGGGS